MADKGLFRRIESHPATKRLSDIVLSLGAMVVFSRRFIKTYRAVKTEFGDPVFFKQERVGQHGKIFTMYKFRTMTDARDADGNLLPDEQRITPYGQHLRTTGMDELPQLWNILKGDMSVVGWRGRKPEDMKEFGPVALSIIYNTRPGLLGSWQLDQIHRPEEITFERMVDREVKTALNDPSFLRGCQYIFYGAALFIKAKRNYKPKPNNGNHPQP